MRLPIFRRAFLMKTELYLMNVCSDSFKKDYQRYFSLKSQNRILKYKNVEDRLRSICAELLARYFVAKKIPRTFEEILILRDTRGKPYVANSDIQISLSHSRNWIACSVSSEPVGVDVEEDFSDALEIAEKFFAPQEYFLLKNLPNSQLRRKFLSLWTLKESYGKFLGCGLSEELLSMDIEEFFATNINLAYRNFYLPDGAVVGICSAPPAPSDYFLVQAEEIKPL